jgi:hypothetical protein
MGRLNSFHCHVHFGCDFSIWNAFLLFSIQTVQPRGHLSLLVDPVELGLLPALDLALLEPESNLLLGVLDAVAAVADVAADVLTCTD